MKCAIGRVCDKTEVYALFAIVSFSFHSFFRFFEPEMPGVLRDSRARDARVYIYCSPYASKKIPKSQIMNWYHLFRLIFQFERSEWTLCFDIYPSFSFHSFFFFYYYIGYSY